MWFKHGLKAQKLLAQGNTLGIKMLSPLRPVRAKALNICCFITNFIWDLQETFRFSCKSQFFFVLLQLSCCGWLAMSRWLGKNPWLGLS